MLLLSEISSNDTKHVSKVISEVYKIPVELKKEDLTDWFNPLPELKGYWYSPELIDRKLKQYYPRTAAMILTPRDIYCGDKSANDEFLFGYCQGKFQVVSIARMKGIDSTPTSRLITSQDIYMKRLLTMVIHELGHDLISDRHMKKAYWVNKFTGEKFPLGEHCIDNKCVMYEVIDVLTSSKSVGYILIDGKKKYDAGLDEHIQRIRADWFCDECRQSMAIPRSYRIRTDR